MSMCMFTQRQPDTWDIHSHIQFQKVLGLLKPTLCFHLGTQPSSLSVPFPPHHPLCPLAFCCQPGGFGVCPSLVWKALSNIHSSFKSEFTC